MANQDKNKIAPLENDYHKAQLALYQKEQKRLVFRRRRLIVILLAAICILAFSGYQVLKDGKKLLALRQQEETTLTKQQSLTQQENSLTNEVNLLKNEEYVGKLARSRYLLSKDGEVVYTIPNQTTPTEKTEEPAETTSSSAKNN